MQHTLRNKIKQALAFTAGIGALFALSALTVLAVGVTKTYAATDCDTNAIMNCGFSSPSNFIATTKAGDSRGHHDLAAIYNYFKLPSSDYANFIKNAKAATFYKNGDVYVGGQKVATDAVSYGRLQSYHTGTGMKTIHIGSTTLYGNSTSRTFASNSLSGYVLFDATGTPKFMVIGSCGNPVTAKVVQSGIACKLLNAKPVAGKSDTYEFTGSGTATGLAKIINYTYDFGDGTMKSTSSASTVYTHTYTKEGTYVAKLTVSGTAPGSTQITIAPAGSCLQTITVKLPFGQCVQLDGTTLDQNTYSYRFTATMKYGNGAEFSSADFDFGDGQTKTLTTADSATSVSVDHTYGKAGTYNIAAVLHFSVSGTQPFAANTCYSLVTPTAPPTPECKPGIPVGDVRCNPCPTDASIDKNDERCVTVTTTLPNTGAGNVIAVGAVALIGGFLVYRHQLFKKHKAAYRAADFGTSALPLAEPFDDHQQPLAGTPLQPQRKLFHRRRQF